MKNKHLVTTFLVGSIYIFANAPVFANNSLTPEIKVPTSEIINIINSNLRGSKIHLNNYGKRHRYSYHKKKDSYIQIGKFHNEKFNIPEVGKGPFKYYVNDINLRNYRIQVNNGKFIVKFYFEDKGTEIKGRCKGSWKTKYLCVRGSDKSAPDVHISNAVATAYLTPAVRNGSISFSNVAVDFNANVRVGKTCGKIGYCRSKVNQLKNSLVSNLKSKIHKAVNKENLKNSIAKTVKSKLKRYNVNRIVSLKLGKKYTQIKFKVGLGQLSN